MAWIGVLKKIMKQGMSRVNPILLMFGWRIVKNEG